jgi:catechol 2,3-dioxygenase-like lactoylglutathione lyase family enzyme
MEPSAMNTFGVGHTILTVSDLARSRAFYHDLLGFPVSDFDSDGFSAFMIPVGETEIWFLTHDATPPGDTFSEFRIGLDHISFVAPNETALHDLVDQLRQADVPTAGVETFFTGNKYVVFRDPDNIQLEYWMDEHSENVPAEIEVASGTIRRAALVEFLLEAKRVTYAAMDDTYKVSDPALPGSSELAYRDGAFGYRDVYYGGDFFAEQEVVTHNEIPIWTMTYCGGFLGDQTGTPAFDAVFRGALRQVGPDRPYRGPSRYSVGEYTYTDHTRGALERFQGREVVWRAGRPVYALKYQGGFLK